MDIPFGSTFNDPAVKSAMGGIAQAPVPRMGIVKNALNGGEISPEMLARHDLPRYQLGCESLLNMIPMPGGGITKRPGFALVSGTAGASEDGVRLLPFRYSASAQCMLMFLANAGGGQLYALDRDGRRGASPGPVTPWKAGELGGVCFCQCGKNIYCAHENYPPAKLVCQSIDNGLPTFTYEEINFRIKTPAPAQPGISSWGYWDDASANDQTYVITAVNAMTGEESLPSPPVTWRCPPPSSSRIVQILPPAPMPDNVAEYRVYKFKGGQYGFVGRVARPHTFFNDDGFAPDMLDQPPKEFEGLQKPGDYPSVVFLHQQRLGWASSLNDPLTIWMSQTSNFECMQAKTPPNDDDAIEATLASSQANRILWCISDRSGLAIGTEGEEWYLTGAEGGAAISPGSIGFQPQTAYGTKPGIAPARANSSLIFVQRGGKVLRDMGYSFAADRYEAQDLTLLARHIFRHSHIVDMCWQGAPHNILWTVLANGKLAGLTYMPEHEITAWHRHETNGEFKACACMDTSNGEPRLWVLTERPYGRFVEIMRPHTASRHNAWGEDAAGGSDADPLIICTDGQANDTYRARCIPCLPEAQTETGMTAMRVKKINAVKARVIDSQPFSCRVISQGLPASETMPVPITPQACPPPGQAGHAAAYDWPCPLGAGWREGAKLELIMDGPKPVTILAICAAVEVASETGGPA